jgi:hypothetical protein
MNSSQLSPRTVGFGLSVAVTSILSTLLVIIKEMNEDTVLAWMRRVTPHHWITHGVMVVVVFVVLGVVLSKQGGQGESMGPGRLAGIIFAAAAISFAAISGFYLLE